MTLSVGEFYVVRRTGRPESKCKKCKREYNAENRRRNLASYRERDRAAAALRDRTEYSRQWYQRNKNLVRSYARRNRAKINERARVRYHEDEVYRAAKLARCRIRDAISGERSASTSELLGCSFSQFVAHIERHMLDGMSWDNHGVSWEIDHHIPLAAAPDANWVEVLAHFTNCRPLWKADNRCKSDSLPAEVFIP